MFNNLFAGTYTVCEVPQTNWFAITPNVQNTTYNQPLLHRQRGGGAGGLGALW
ncbi:MAG: hypothetical protein R2911_01300 [Caldilineaceae bacterium]